MNRPRRIAILFSGGPAPAANAVISSAAVSCLEGGHEVVGIFHGYSNLVDYHPVTHRLIPDEHYREFELSDMRALRNERGICIGTARTNPGKGITSAEDLKDPAKTARLQSVYSALIDLKIDGLISIGGDDTLKTANFLYLYQQNLPESAPKFSVVHLPKTIDNDYSGIDFTFGFFTAVDFMAKEALNLRADAKATSSWFIIETMGRKAGWLPYGVAIAGEADLVLATEDLDESLMTASDGKALSMDALADRITDLIVTREERDKQAFGTIVLAEGLAEMLPLEFLEGIHRDDHGHISLSKLNLAETVAQIVMKRYADRTGRIKKLRSVQLGYESRCSAPHAFDVMLGCQLGVGAYQALIQNGLNGHMVSVEGQLDLTYVPFDQLIDPDTLITEVRFIQPGSDFHRLARFLETRMEATSRWTLGRRTEPEA